MMRFYTENLRILSQVIIPVEHLLNQWETQVLLSYSHVEEEEFIGFKYIKEIIT